MSRISGPLLGLGGAALLAVVVTGILVELPRSPQPIPGHSDGAAPATSPAARTARPGAGSNSEPASAAPVNTPSPKLGAAQADETAREQLLARANTGDVSAQAELCRQDIRSPNPQILARAHFWCSVAAQAGDPPSQRYYADLLREGEGVPKDEQAALDWYEKAAQHRDTGALYVLGNILLERNTPADEARGLGLIQDAARMGDSRAISLLQRRGMTSEPHYSEQADFPQGTVR